MNFNFFVLVLFFLLINNCGFKPLENQIDFTINEIEVSGDKRISYKIINKLKTSTVKNKNKIVNLDIEVNKKINIKEKNIKNEVTKYEIIITANVEYNIIGIDKEKKFIVSNLGEYLAAKQYSNEIKNERFVVELITDDIVSKIINKIKLHLNDL
jgi:hypothetical protein